MSVHRLVACTLFALVVVSILVIRASSAAFVASVDNPDNFWETGTVVIDDDAVGTALFTSGNIAPGHEDTECISVTYNGSANAQVRVYVGDLTDTNDLADDLLLTIEQGTGGQYGDCSGFSPGATLADEVVLSSVADAHDSFANGLDNWNVTDPGQERTYRLTVELDANSNKQLSEASLDLVWEAQSQP